MLISGKTELIASLIPIGNEETPVFAEIINLSEEGMGFIFRNKPSLNLYEGRRFILKEIQGNQSLRFLTGIEMEIKWIIGYHPSRGIRLGCVFSQITETVRDKIRQSINRQIDNKISDMSELN